MPLYEYECESCQHRFERIQKFSDPLADVCPECGGPVRKLVSSPAIRFKGTGWYVTDYAKKDKTDGKGKQEKDASKGEGTSSSDKASSAKGEAKTSGSSDAGAKGSSDGSSSSPKASSTTSSTRT